MKNKDEAEKEVESVLLDWIKLSLIYMEGKHGKVQWGFHVLTGWIILPGVVIISQISLSFLIVEMKICQITLSTTLSSIILVFSLFVFNISAS